MGILSADALGLSTDLLGPGKDFIAEVRRRVAAETDLAPGEIVVERNLEPECTVLAATHAHSTPDTYGILRLWERDDCRCWFETLAGQLVSALTRAFRDLSPARLSWSQLQLGGMGANRRMRDEQGRIFSRNRKPQDAVVIDEGCTDETLCVVLAQREAKGPVVLANYACHPVTLQVQPMMSADYPGVGCALVEQALGRGACVCSCRERGRHQPGERRLATLRGCREIRHDAGRRHRQGVGHAGCRRARTMCSWPPHGPWSVWKRGKRRMSTKRFGRARRGGAGAGAGDPW